MRNFVYIFSVGTHQHKVGISRNPESRLATLQTGNAEKIVFSKFGECLKAYEVEQECHRILSDCRLEGEWFYGPLAKIDQALTAAWYVVRGKIPYGDIPETEEVEPEVVKRRYRSKVDLQ